MPSSELGIYVKHDALELGQGDEIPEATLDITEAGPSTSNEIPSSVSSKGKSLLITLSTRT